MSLEEYYDRRATEYEEMYFRDDPIRLAELQKIAETLRKKLTGCNVLEIACGTGYWTRILSEFARSVVAIDSSPKMLELAVDKGLSTEQITFHRADAFSLDAVPGEFDAAVANFWLSHVSQEKVADFLDGLHRRVGAGTRVVMADNVYIPGVGGELVNTDENRDSYKRRTLKDGSEHLVLKNYYDESQHRELLVGRATDLEITFASHFWWLSYTVS